MFKDSSHFLLSLEENLEGFYDESVDVLYHAACASSQSQYCDTFVRTQQTRMVSAHLEEVSLIPLT